MQNNITQSEKKVEYVELIYDLIFVFIIGRNNSLLHNITNGFIDSSTYLTYIICTLITIQIWYLTTLFINKYGSNDFTEYIGLFISMYLLYYMADGTRVHWQTHFYRYNIAWMLILINLAVQYYLKYRKVKKTAPWELADIKQNMRRIIIQAAIVLVGILLYAPTGLPLVPAAMIFGLVAAIVARKKHRLVAIDFMHLTERVML